MKAIYAILVLTGLLVSVQQSGYAQNLATAKGTAGMTVVSGISIQQKHTLNFGTFTAPTGGDGTITMSAVGIGPLINQNAPAVTPVPGGGVATVNTIHTAGNGGEPVQLGTFEVFGEPGYGFAVTLPTGPVNVLPTVSRNGLHVITMTLSAFTTNLPSNSGLIGTGINAGFLYFAVGATLIVHQNQASGDYNGDYPITVNYN